MTDNRPISSEALNPTITYLKEIGLSCEETQERCFE